MHDPGCGVGCLVISHHASHAKTLVKSGVLGKHIHSITLELIKPDMSTGTHVWFALMGKYSAKVSVHGLFFVILN